MKCANCGNNISKVIINKFRRDGSDGEVEADLTFSSDGDDLFATFVTDANWTGYELTDEERMDGIRCPRCGKFPFSNKSVDVDEQVVVICSSKVVRSSSEKLEDFSCPMECFRGQNCISCQKHITNLDGTCGYPCMTCEDNDGCKSCLVKGTWMCKHRGRV